MIYAHYARFVLSRDFRCRIGRRIIHDNDFIRPANGVSRAMNRLQSAAKLRLLVMRRNDERNHGHLRLPLGLTEKTDGRYARIVMKLWPIARSFILKFLSFAIRQPRHMVDDPYHFALIILNEGHLRAIDLEEEIGFRFGIKIQSTAQCISSESLPD